MATIFKNTISKTQLQNKINLAIAAGKAGMSNFGLFDLKTDKTTVQFKYIGGNLFSMVDCHDPYRGTNGYPKIWDGDIHSFYKEFMRELDWINNAVHGDE